MRVMLAIFALAVAPPAAADRLKFPDPDVSVPPLVHAFIAQTCGLRYGTTDGYEPCFDGEMGGYRATVEMLVRTNEPDRMASHYRACARSGGAETEHFHRRRATCMGKLEGIDWRFEPAGKA